jgi:hypothetical protein
MSMEKSIRRAKAPQRMIAVNGVSLWKTCDAALGPAADLNCLRRLLALA